MLQDVEDATIFFYRILMLLYNACTSTLIEAACR